MPAIESLINTIIDDFVDEDRRKFTYLSIDIQHYILHAKGTPLYYTGSFAEGLDNFDDVDRMLENLQFQVFDRDSKCSQLKWVFPPNFMENHISNFMENYYIPDLPKRLKMDFLNRSAGVLTIETENCHPGFARLLLEKEPLPIFGGLSDIFVTYNGKKYVSSTKYLKCWGSIREYVPYSRHGPSLRRIGAPKDDFVLCFRCGDNLKCTEGFRRLIPDLPKEDIVFHLVPTSHQDSKNAEIEFRWSFSVIETNIIRSFKAKEFQLYFLCKEILKTYFVGKRGNQKGLCSYFVKTMIFFMRDNYRTEFETQSLIPLLSLFLRELKLSLLNKNLPNYFVREYNMYNELTEDVFRDSIDTVERIEGDIFSKILNCKRFQRYEGLQMLSSIYSLVANLEDQKQEDLIVENLLKEKMWRSHEKNKFGFFSSFKEQTIKDLEDAIRHEITFTHFQYIVSLESKKDLSYSEFFIHIFNNLHELFKAKGYKSATIDCFRYYFARYLAIYLMNTAPKRLYAKTNKYHNLINVLTEKSIVIPSRKPIDISSGILTKALYQYLCKNNEEALRLLHVYSKIPSSGRFTFFLTYANPDYSRSILSNDDILNKYFTSVAQDPMLYCSSKVLYLYLMLRVTQCTKFLDDIIKHEQDEHCGHEQEFITLLKLELVK